jgi:hypothetical protein
MPLDPVPFSLPGFRRGRSIPELKTVIATRIAGSFERGEPVSVRLHKILNFSKALLILALWLLYFVAVAVACVFLWEHFFHIAGWGLNPLIERVIEYTSIVVVVYATIYITKSGTLKRGKH